VARLLSEAGFQARLDRERGLDHGAWVPLRFLYPNADVPVIEVSQLLRRNPEDALRMGAALSRLREEGVLLVGTGGIVHNLSRLDLGATEPSAWALEFDEWVAARLDPLDIAGIADYRQSAPHAGLAVPTPEHFDPIFVVLGSARPGERATTIHEGFRYGTLSMRSFAIA
jgi:4,5-DOPA dioxygenase extradiol